MLKNSAQAAVVILQLNCQSRRSWVHALPAESLGAYFYDRTLPGEAIR